MATTPRPYLWKTAELISDAADETGATFHFYDANAQAIYPHSGLKYKYGGVPEGHWEELEWSEEESLESTDYEYLKGDHPATGSLYIIALHRTSKDTLYLFRYDYERDVSELVENIMVTSQSDNPIAQITASVKNTKDSLFTKESSLFVPTSRIQVGVAYGKSSIVTLVTGYTDQIEWRYGKPTVSITGRNTVGYFMNSQTFDEDKSFKGDVTTILPEIFERFGVTKYEIDDSDTKKIEFDVSASDTGMKALQIISDLMSDILAEPPKQWDVEEMYDGTIICGFAPFRSDYMPKGNYVFHGRNDVFENNITRSIDGSFTHVRCTGTKKDGYDLTPVVREVTPWQYWTPGEHRTYHAPRLSGVTQEELNKYCELLAKQLKEGGQTAKYKSTLRPQLFIGDVAQVEGEENENKTLGIVTEIKHTLGGQGYMTEFTAASGGEIQTIGNKVYTKSKGVNGSNRTPRVTDFIQSSSEAGEYMSKGEGPTPQPSMEEFDYAHFDGTGYITLPITAKDITSGVRIEVSFELDNYESDMAVFGNASGMALLHLSTGYSDGNWNTSDGSTAYSFTAPSNGKHVYVYNINSGNTQFSTNGTFETIHTSISPSSLDAALYIGHRAGGQNNFIGKLRYFRVYNLESSEEIMLLKAAQERDANGSITHQGLYDRVSKTWYSCEGLTVNKKIITKYAWAHFDGRGYIELAHMIQPYINTYYRIFCAFKLDSFIGNMAVWGNMRDKNLAHLYTGSVAGQWHTSNGYSGVTFNTDWPVTNNQFTFVLNDDNQNFMYYNDRQYLVTESYAGVTESTSIRIGGGYDISSRLHGDISKFQIYDQEHQKYIVDMYPAQMYMADGTLLQTGLYDKVNDRWYTCEGMTIHN